MSKPYLETQIEEDLSSESEDTESDFLDQVMEPFNPAEINIAVKTITLDLLIKRIRHQEIDMHTDFQRNADLWNNQTMSRLIESILIRFPLPAFYFDASDEENWLIVDGLQRLSTIQKFVIDNTLTLSGLEFLTELNGKNFDTLHRQYQRRIEECLVTTYMIQPGTPPEVKYSVFRRINTGGLTLNNQEIRNAMAQPQVRKLLQELSQLETSRLMLGDLSRRMKDQELVLRFWAFYRFNYLDKADRKEIAAFLDKAMEDIKNGDDDYRELIKKTYTKAIERCYQLLGENGFEKNASQNSGKRPKNTSLFEVWMVELAKLSDEKFDYLLSDKDCFREQVKELLEDKEFFDAITYSTQKLAHVKIRYQKIRNLIEAMLLV